MAAHPGAPDTERGRRSVLLALAELAGNRPDLEVVVHLGREAGGRRPFPDRLKALGRMQPPAVLHHRNQQRLPAPLVSVHGDHVMVEPTVVAVVADDLLASRPGRLPGGALAARLACVFL